MPLSVRAFTSPPPVTAALAVLISGCVSQGADPAEISLDCSIPTSLIFDGGPGKDGIPSLSNPMLVAAGDPGSQYLFEDDRVQGFVVDGQAIAVPLNIQWWHEIVNFDLGAHRLAVTYCPLTGSGLIFDRGSVGNVTFGVSGLLFMNNLIMYDRSSEESLWPQMARGARCGPKRDTALRSFPSIELTWATWRELHPQTKVVSSETGHFRDYRAYPYGNYDQPENPEILFPMPSIDRRRPPKERVLGIPTDSTGGIAFPFGELAELGSVAAVHTTIGSVRQVVFWDSIAQGAAAYLASTPKQTLSFRVEGGQIVDAETRSTWRLDGLATAGPLAGTRLEAVADAFVAFWFAWAAFYPQAELWNAGSTP